MCIMMCILDVLLEYNLLIFYIALQHMIYIWAAKVLFSMKSCSICHIAYVYLMHSQFIFDDVIALFRVCFKLFDHSNVLIQVACFT